MSYPDTHSVPILLQLPLREFPVQLQLPKHLQLPPSFKSFILDIKLIFSWSLLWEHLHLCYHGYHVSDRYFPLPFPLHVTMPSLLLFWICHWEPKSHNILAFVSLLNDNKLTCGINVELKIASDKSIGATKYISDFGNKQKSKSHETKVICWWYRLTSFVNLLEQLNVHDQP